MMKSRSEELKRHLEKIKILQAEYERALETAQEVLLTIKDEAKRNALEKRIDDSMRKRAELTAELNDYVDYITTQHKNNDRGFSL